MNSSTSPSTDQPGEWVTPQVSYVDPRRIACALCGRPIPRKYWRAAVRKQVLIFCEPAHATLYETYWLPTHGKSGDESVG